MVIVRGHWLAAVCAALLVAAGSVPTHADPDPLEEPEQFVWEGFLECSISHTGGYQPINCPESLFPEQDDRRDLDVEDDVKSVVVYMDWHVPTIAFTDTMRNWLYVGAIAMVRNLGPPPMEFRYDAPADGSHPTDLEFRVWAGGGGGNLNVVLDAAFTVHYHVFYDDWAPDGYSAAPQA